MVSSTLGKVTKLQTFKEGAEELEEKKKCWEEK